MLGSQLSVLAQGKVLSLESVKVKVRMLAGLESYLAWGKNPLPKESRFLAIFSSWVCGVVLHVSLLAINWGPLFRDCCAP